MKISTKGRYALRMMVSLAKNAPGEHRTIKSIAEEQELSNKYLEQIITVFNKSGYVTSIRGAQGGYRLSNPPDTYTVGMILRLVEGSIVPVACLEDDPNKCKRQDKCATLDVWRQIEEAINGVVDNITLADIVEKEESKARV